MEQKKQHGGRRPGAGAPSGNFNGYRTGNHSERMLAVYLMLLAHPDPKGLAHELYRAGFFPPPAMRFNQDVRGAVRYLYKRWFIDGGLNQVQSSAIKSNQVHAHPDGPAAPPADTNPPPEPPAKR